MKKLLLFFFSIFVCVPSVITLEGCSESSIVDAENNKSVINTYGRNRYSNVRGKDKHLILSDVLLEKKAQTRSAYGDSSDVWPVKYYSIYDTSVYFSVFGYNISAQLAMDVTLFSDFSTGHEATLEFYNPYGITALENSNLNYFNGDSLTYSLSITFVLDGEMQMVTISGQSDY